MLTTLLLAALALQGERALPPVPQADADKLRTAFAEALAEPRGERRGKAAEKLLALARTLEKKHDHASLMDALRAGPKLAKGEPEPRGKGKDKESFQRLGTTIHGFTFTSQGASFRYLVDVPEGYDPSQPAPLVLDPGHGSGAKLDAEGKANFVPYFRNAAKQAGIPEALVARTEIIEQVGADGLFARWPEEQVAAVFDDFFRDLASRFAIDPDRVIAGGISQTGFWSWYLGRARPDRFAGIAPLASVTWHVDKYLECFANLPVYVVHGSEDTTCPVAQPRKTTKALAELGYPCTYVEIPGAGHEGRVFGRLGEALTALSAKPRAPWPESVRRALLTTQNPWCSWVRVTKLEKEGDGKAGSPPVARLEAKVEGQRIEILSHGVKALELWLARELCDLAQPIVVVWNTRTVHSGPVPPRFEHAVENALERADWKSAGETRLELH
jgi:dienelactone hydrolase